ncbi:MAG: ubiquitin-like domain-containing protein [Anaerolineae bacterium]|nr:ubiquitin-like domain-containing protein [Anaerolineae bacterium]
MPLLLIAGTGLVWGYQRTGITVQVSVDELRETVHTHQATVGRLLDELGLVLHAEDLLTPPAETPLRSDLSVQIVRARPVEIEADGQTLVQRTHARTVAQVLDEAGLRLGSHDELWLNRQPATLLSELPPRQLDGDAPRFARGHVWDNHQAVPLRLSLRRAVPITVDDGGMPFVIQTTAPTVGEALLREQITLYLGDRVMPGLGSRVSAGMRIFIQRSTPIAIRVDGHTVKTRTRQETVGDALAEQGITVVGLDRVSPPMSEPLVDNLVIEVTRVREAIEIEQEPIPFASVWVPDDNLELDHQRLDEAGAEGVTKRRLRVVYEDGLEVSRALEDVWVAQEPVARVLAYGRKIVTRTLETPEGTLVYWRKVRMAATSYSASTAGKSPDHPSYGRTRLGQPMRKGIVAVDPAVINLGTRVYVPGYGSGVAGDTGSAIKGRRIDLGYDDNNLVLWNRWVDVYLLAPPPPRYQIKWVLPNWPRE